MYIIYMYNISHCIYIYDVWVFWVFVTEKRGGWLGVSPISVIWIAKTTTLRSPVAEIPRTCRAGTVACIAAQILRSCTKNP